MMMSNYGSRSSFEHTTTVVIVIVKYYYLQNAIAMQRRRRRQRHRLRAVSSLVSSARERRCSPFHVASPPLPDPPRGTMATLRDRLSGAGVDRRYRLSCPRGHVVVFYINRNKYVVWTADDGRFPAAQSQLQHHSSKTRSIGGDDHQSWSSVDIVIIITPISSFSSPFVP